MAEPLNRVHAFAFLDQRWQRPYNASIVFRGNSSVVEHNLAKVGVASSSLVSRSSFQGKWILLQEAICTQIMRLC